MWDASALAKRYVTENGSPTVNVLIESSAYGLMTFTLLGYAETYAILRRRMNAKIFTQSQYAFVNSALRLDVIESLRYEFAPVESLILTSLPLIERHNLNSSDAAILAAYLRYQSLRQPGETCVLVASDHRLLRSARAEGLPAFDLATYREGHLSPVYFGSALKNFGVAELLGALAAYAPSPRDQTAIGREVHPADEDVTGVVFKVQAHMDPNHRDRVAFLRLASGRFRRNMKLKQSGTGKSIGVHNPILFFASERETVDEAWPGDIIGIPNHGVLRVGDTLSESGSVIFTGIPNFAPEILRRVRLSDPMKQKHLARALESLAEEGVTQLFKPQIGSQWIVGVVGMLQLDVLKSRLVAEYSLEADLEPAPYDAARWLSGTDAEIEKFAAANRGGMASDRDGAPVFLAKSAWEMGYVTEKFPGLKFLRTRERHEVHAES